MTNLLDRYYETKTAIDILTKDLDDLKIILIERLKATEGNKLENNNATFSLRKTTTYEYSPVIVEAEKLIKDQTMGVKAMKADEEGRGVAKVVSTNYAPVVTKKK